MLRKFSLLATISVASFAAPAIAQDAASSNIATDGSGEIIVTAQKRAESIQKVPISITAVSGEQIATRQIYDPAQLQYVAPSLSTTSFNGAVGATNFSVRGIGTLSFADTIEPTVSTVIDDVVMGRPQLGVANFFDISSVEVLNGPQGMLFGKNASAGLVHIKTTQPKLDTFEAIGRASYGSVNSDKRGSEWIAQSTVNIPIAQTTALRVNAFFTDHSPIIQNKLSVPGSDYGQEQYGFKAKLRWNPGSNFDIVIAGDYTKSNGNLTGSTTDRVLDPNSPFGGLNAALGIVAGPDNTYLASNGITNTHYSVGGVQANATYTFDNDMSLTNIAAWRSFKMNNQFDVDNHQINIADFNLQHANYKQFTNELRLSSPSNATLEYQLGLYYYHATARGDAQILGNLGFGPPPPPFKAWIGLAQATKLVSDSYAAFGQATYHVTDAARIVLGGRVTRDELDYRRDADPNGTIISLVGPVPTTVVNTAEKTNFSYRVIGQYDIASNVMFYASYSRGYKGPGFNGDSTLIQPEIPQSFEAGIKFKSLDRKVTFNLAAYTEKFSNFQAQGFDVAAQQFRVVNAGSLKSDGFEAQLALNPMDGLNLTANFNYANSRYGSYVNDQCYPGQVAKCNLATGIADSSGNALPNSPKITATLGMDYRREISEGLEIKTSANMYYRDKVNFSSNGDPRRVQPSYTLFDLSAGLGASDGRWGLTAFCRNCGDKRFVSYIEVNPALPSTPSYGQQFGIQAFRTLGVALDFRFN